MSDYPWLHPDLEVVPTVLAAGLFVLHVVLGPIRGPRRYRELAAARAAGDPDVLSRWLTGRVRRQAVITVLVVVVVLVFGPDRRSVGLALPAGSGVARAWGWTAYFCAIVLVSGLLLRRRALRGQTVPGQRIVAAIIPDSAAERRLGALASLGAGVSEELVFRGLFTATCVAAFHLGVVASVLLVSVLFGVAHTYQGWFGILGTGILGGLLSWTYLLSQSLLVPMIIHVVIDLRGLVLVPLQRPDAVSRRPRRPREPRATSGPVETGPTDGPPALP